MNKGNKKTLTYESKKQIEDLYKKGYKKMQIAELMGVHRSTISREIERGWNNEEQTYSAKISDIRNKEKVLRRNDLISKGHLRRKS